MNALAKLSRGAILGHMLQLSGSVLNRPVLSLRTGGLVAIAEAAIINPNNLKIEGFYCQDNFDRKKTVVLLSQDIRDIIPQGFVVNDHEVLAEPEELVRLKKLMELGFEVIGKPVFTSSKERLGKVVDFAVDSDSMFIFKIYVGQPLLKNIMGGNLGIDRNQITEITDKRITVQDLSKRIPAAAKAWA